MARASSLTKLLFAILVLSTVLMAGAACDPGKSYDIVNDTGEPVVLIANGHEIDLAAGETASYFAAEGRGTDRWTVVNQSGAVLMEFDFSWDQLIERDFRIVVR